ncbi:putative gustatory receptor 39b [Anopheles nili]|uniref:putative gustatory receptor 39b n=1 Tax=Anopheles nili TaxID=185578 RepID=UPI00237C08ED|nr:putative gustatory receptor 39b [Anopheles nili]
MNILKPLLPTDRQLLCVVFAIFKLFGFFPFPFDCYAIKLVPSGWVRALLHLPVLQILSYIGLTCIAIEYRSYIFYSHLQIISMNDLLKFGSQIMAIYVIFINTILERGVHRDVWRKLDTASNYIQRRRIHRFFRRYLWKFYGYVAFSALIEARVAYNSFDTPEFFLYWKVIVCINVFIRLRHLYHLFFIDALKVCQQQLHVDLQEVCEYIRNLQLNPPTEPSEYREVYDRAVSRLLKLKTAYGDLWELCDCINRNFGWSQICNFCTNFVQLSCDMYWLYLSINGLFNGFKDIFITLLPTACLIWILLYSAESCLRVASLLKMDLLEIPLGNDSTLRKITYRFGLQIDQQKIRLTAHELFEINYSLLKMFGTGITTYMIIFITFSKEIPFKELEEELSYE